MKNKIRYLLVAVLISIIVILIVGCSSDSKPIIFYGEVINYTHYDNGVTYTLLYMGESKIKMQGHHNFVIGEAYKITVMSGYIPLKLVNIERIE